MLKTSNPFIETSASILPGGNRYTYVLSNPLKYTDPSGYVYRYDIIQAEKCLNELMKSGGSSGESSADRSTDWLDAWQQLDPFEKALLIPDNFMTDESNRLSDYNEPGEYTVKNSTTIDWYRGNMKDGKLKYTHTKTIRYSYSYKYTITGNYSSTGHLQIAYVDGSYKSSSKSSYYNTPIESPGKIPWNPKKQKEMAIHTMKWIRYAEIVNWGTFDLRDAFSNFKYTESGGTLGFSVFALDLKLGDVTFGFSASHSIYPNLDGSFNSLVSFSANDQNHFMIQPYDDHTLWRYNRNSRGSIWGTQHYNYDKVADYLYSGNY